MQHSETVSESLENGSYQDGASGRLVELLDRKRKQLDEEMADFKATKETEYRLYEQHLRSEHKSVTGEQHISGGASSEASRQDNSQQPVNNNPQWSVAELDKTDKESGVEDIGEKTSGTKNGEDRRPARIDLVDGPAQVVEDGPTATGRPFASTPPRDREKEFRGLFTPSYLPLLDGPNNGHAQMEAVKPISPSISRSNSTPSLSSSATLATITITPLLPSASPQRLSASVPRQKPPHRRSSSTRSDSSLTNLRSSLRDPRQPRSPKRVLFSIDNTLVSPNSSPVARRTVPLLLPPPSGIAGPQEPAQEEEYNTFDRDNSAVQEIENAIDESVHPSFAIQQAVNTMINTSSPSRGLELVEPIMTSPTVGGDDFEDIDNDDDPLFAFDEEVDMQHSEDDESDQVYHSYLPWSLMVLMYMFRTTKDPSLKTKRRISCQWPRPMPAVYPLKLDGLQCSR